MAKDTYVVVGPYATVTTMTADGKKVIGLHSGAVLPGDVAQEHIDHLVSHGLVAKVGAEPVQVDRSADELVAYHQATLDAITQQRQELDDREQEVKAALDTAKAQQARDRKDGDPNAAFRAEQEAAAAREAERAGRGDPPPGDEPGTADAAAAQAAAEDAGKAADGPAEAGKAAAAPGSRSGGKGGAGASRASGTAGGTSATRKR